MAGTKINDYAVGQDKWDELLTTIEKQRKGFIALSLTNYDNNSEPAIAAGGYIEISGALYGFTSEEAINGTPSSGNTNYIYIDTTDLKPYWTTTAPTWSTDKNGWYDSTETDRYIGGCYYDGANYTGKWVYTTGQLIRKDNIEDDAVSAEKISGLTGTGAVDLDNIPEGSTNKYFSGKTLDNLPDGSTYKKVTGVNSSHQITNSSISKDNTEGDFSVPAGDSWVIPAGIYVFVSYGSPDLKFYIYADGNWRGTNFYSGVIFSDGTHMKFQNSGETSKGGYYRKLS